MQVLNGWETDSRIVLFREDGGRPVQILLAGAGVLRRGARNFLQEPQPRSLQKVIVRNEGR